MKKTITLFSSIILLTLSSCSKRYLCDCEYKYVGYVSSVGNKATYGYDASSKKDAQATCDQYATDTASYSSCSLQ